MGSTFYFYDLETSGFNPREQRIMQFAGQRTDMSLKPVGEPHNHFIRLTDDVAPDPDAVLITGITPQQTITEGITEAEFLKVFYAEIALPDTIFVGFNTVRFDDEFMRFLHYRNFYDPYEWQWKDSRSRWDMLDVVRMTRALRPEGIKWPVDSAGKPTNRLELLTSVNKLDHQHAHDALNDVMATIAVARLVRNKQPKLFEFLLGLRTKKAVAALVEAGQPFVYTSGKYAGEFQKTTVVVPLADHPNRQASLVYDLRFDPTPFAAMTPEQLAEAWKWNKDPNAVRLPVKTMQYNRCPAIAPLGVLKEGGEEAIGLTIAQAQTNLAKLQAITQDFVPKLLTALELLDKAQQTRLLEDDADVDGRLYDNFFEDVDRTKMSVVRAATAGELPELDVHFKDSRLQALLPLYKVRNFRDILSDEERVIWEKYRHRKLLGGGTASRLARYFARLGELAERPGLTAQQQYLLEELQLYGQSIMPDEL
jgi:exodeoxyribonuclease-1